MKIQAKNWQARWLAEINNLHLSYNSVKKKKKKKKKKKEEEENAASKFLSIMSTTTKIPKILLQKIQLNTKIQKIKRNKKKNKNDSHSSSIPAERRFSPRGETESHFGRLDN